MRGRHENPGSGGGPADLDEFPSAGINFQAVLRSRIRILLPGAGSIQAPIPAQSVENLTRFKFGHLLNLKQHLYLNSI